MSLSHYLFEPIMGLSCLFKIIYGGFYGLCEVLLTPSVSDRKIRAARLCFVGFQFTKKPPFVFHPFSVLNIDFQLML